MSGIVHQFEVGTTGKSADICCGAEFFRVQGVEDPLAIPLKHPYLDQGYCIYATIVRAETLKGA
jgi:hypothetical protein